MIKAIHTATIILVAQLTLSCAHMRNTEAAKPDYDVIVVGAGLGGLTTAARLAQSGLKVLVLEKQGKVGGCTTSFSRGEFNFDAALHQLSLGANSGQVREILYDLRVLEKVELLRSPELARSVFPGIDFTTPADKDHAIIRMKARWPDEAEDIEEFFELCENIAEDLVDLSEMYRTDPLSNGLTRALVPLLQPYFFRWRNATLEEILDEFFEDEELKAVISQYWVYFGPPPSKIWAPMFMTAYYSYVKNGAWQVRGSSQALSDAFADSIVEAGGTVRTGVRVSKIVVDDGVVSGVVTSTGERLTSRYVVSNADPFQTFHILIDKEESPQKTLELIGKLKPSNSLAGVYLGLDVEPSHWGISEYEIFYNTTLDADAMYNAMIEGRFEDGAVSMTFYTNIGDEFYAPPGKSVMVLNAYADSSYWPALGPEYFEKKKQMEEKLLDIAEKMLPGLRKHIVVREGMTPYTIESFTAHKGGVPYGWDMVPDHYERLGNETPIEGLYLAGSWAGMIHGASGAILSGNRAARLILDEEDLD